MSGKFCVLRYFLPHCQADELEEGEIAISGDSHMDVQQSGSWNQEREEGEDEQVLQPKVKRKRSIRLRPRHVAERPEEKFTDKPSIRCGDSLQLPYQGDHKHDSQFKNDRGRKVMGEPTTMRPDPIDTSAKSKRNLQSRKLSNTSKVHGSLKSGRANFSHSDDALQNSRDNSDSKVLNVGGTSSGGSKMPEVIQKKVCLLISFVYVCSIVSCKI